MENAPSRQEEQTLEATVGSPPSRFSSLPNNVHLSFNFLFASISMSYRSEKRNPLDLDVTLRRGDMYIPPPSRIARVTPSRTLFSEQHKPPPDNRAHDRAGLRHKIPRNPRNQKQTHHLSARRYRRVTQDLRHKRKSSDSPIPPAMAPTMRKGSLPIRNRVGQRGVGRIVGEVFAAGEETDEGAALLGDVVAEGAGEHGVTSFQCVEDSRAG